MTEDQDIRKSLARAFDRVWDGYYRSSPATVSRDVARTELARKLVQLSKQGIRDEDILCADALVHLQELMPGDGKPKT